MLEGEAVRCPSSSRPCCLPRRRRRRPSLRFSFWADTFARSLAESDFQSAMFCAVSGSLCGDASSGQSTSIPCSAMRRLRRSDSFEASSSSL